MHRTSGELPQSAHNADRIRRARSWLERSEKSASDLKKAKSEEEKAGLHCEQFIFLWIAFNAAYGYALIDENVDADYPGEREQFSRFLKEVLKRDDRQAIYTILWETYSGPIRILLNNQYVFGPFWKQVRGSQKVQDWREQFRLSKKRVNNAWERHDVHGVLVEVFDRLYELRNQIFHGGATFATGWGQGQGQDQVWDGSRIMASLVPVIVGIMDVDIKNDPDSETWGKVAYPRINESPE